MKYNSNLKLYLPINPNILKNNKYKIIAHFISNKKYFDILLIINYNHAGFLKLNDYLLKLYNTFFPYIVFITTDNINKGNIISCNESFNGYYSYICFKKIYEKYPNFKGYLFTNDDVYMKIWELENLDFNLPWFYNFAFISRKWSHVKRCLPIHNILNKKLNIKYNLSKFLGFYDIPKTVADFYYIPDYMAIKFNNLISEFFNKKIFLECAVPTIMAISLYNNYQIIYFNGLWGRIRKQAINILKKSFKQITIHPIKFSKLTHQNEVLLYQYFINAKEF